MVANRMMNWGAAMAALMLFCAWPAPAQKTAPVEAGPAKPGNPAVSSAGFAQDRGKFRILLDGQQVGSEEFELSPSEGTWLARSSTVMRVPGSDDVKSAGQLRVAVDATPIRYEWSAQAQKKASGAVDFAGSTAKTAVNLNFALIIYPRHPEHNYSFRFCNPLKDFCLFVLRIFLQKRK